MGNYTGGVFHDSVKKQSASTSAILNLRPGDVLHGEYQVVKQLGLGGSAVVYKCRALSLGNLLVAVKLLPDNSTQNPTFINRLSKEILAAHVVNHPNVTRFYDCIRDGQFITIVFEYVDGGTLESRINKPNYSLNQAVLWLSQIASGLNAIHKSGIIHRDLKPSNILIGSDMSASITDFGVVATIGEDCKMRDFISSMRSGELNFKQLAMPNHHGTMVGTPFYSSPEYLETNQYDQRLDIYAFGVMAYQLVTGQAPFKAENLFELIESKLHDDPIPPDVVSEGCPRVLSNLIMQAMARDPQKRIQTAAELCEKLRYFTLAGSRSSSAYSSSVNQPSDFRPVYSEPIIQNHSTVAIKVLSVIFCMTLFATLFLLISRPEGMLSELIDRLRILAARYY